MTPALRYILFCAALVAVSCREEKRFDLPRSLTLEEVNAYFPWSEPLVISPYEAAMQEQGLLDLQALDEEIRVELKYSSADNFLGEDLYGTLELAYLQPEPARALTHANRLLRKDNPSLRLLVYDAARPLSVQHLMWNRLDSLSEKERKKYVADPEEASIHNYGCAVDLTILDLETGRPLDMGTPFDYFGELAYPRLERRMLNEGRLGLRQLNNRILLRTIMHDAGFTPITTEWWHFNFCSRKTAELKYRIIE